MNLQGATRRDIHPALAAKGELIDLIFSAIKRPGERFTHRCGVAIDEDLLGFVRAHGLAAEVDPQQADTITIRFDQESSK